MSYIKELILMIIEYKELYIEGIATTLLVSLSGTILGLIIGLFISYFRSSSKNEDKNSNLAKRVLAIFFNCYVEIVRGTPMIVQGVFLYYGLYKYLRWDPLPASIVIVSLNTSAYLSEILRSGIQSIDKGQREAGLAIGMSESQIFRYIILPQAIRNSLPSIGNEFVVNIKDTSVLNAIALTELFFQGMTVAGATFDYSKSMVIIGVIYFILTFTVTRILKVLENRMNIPYNGIRSMTVPE